MARNWPTAPDPERTLHVFSDTHFGVNVPAIMKTDARFAKVVSDAQAPLFGDVAAHVCIGDITNDGTPAQDAVALAWFAQMPADVHIVMGNHEVWQGVRTLASAAASLGLPAPSYTVDLGFAILVSMAFDSTDVAGGLNYLARGAGGVLDWLDTILSVNPDRPHLVCRHAPLQNTVGLTAPNTEYRSIDDGFYMIRSTELRAIYGERGNVIADISGHTHSPITTPELVTLQSAGGHPFAAINGSSLLYQHNTGITPTEALAGLLVTVHDDAIQVRFRDHGARRFQGGPGGLKVIEVPL